MGQRCNLVLIENNQVSVYYDHWAANRLDFELLWGPEITRIFIEEHEQKPDSWLDDIWAEGGCVMNFDTKHLLWYGGEDVMVEPERNLINQELMEFQWKGWTVEWAKDGIFDIAKKAGVPIDIVSSHKPLEAEILQPYSYGTDTYDSETYDFFYANNVMSYVRQGDLSWAVLFGDVVSLANVELTLESVSELIRGFSETEFEKAKLLHPQWGSFTEWGGFNWGAHLDFDTSSLAYWSPDPCEGLQVLVNNQLPKWTVVNHGPDYLWHQALVPSKDWPTITVQKKLDLIQNYRQQLSRNNTNPVINIMNTMISEGQQNIRVNPSVWEHRKGNQDLLAVKNSILDNLELEIKRKG